MTARPAGTERHLRALIVEDDTDDCFFLRRELERSGFEVTWLQVETAPTMRAALEEHTWDVVLSDFRLPAFSAPEALATLKATGKDIPFIIVSGTIGEETAVDALKAGAHDFLVKGRLSRLAPAIERELRDVATRRERAEAEVRLRESEARFRRIIETSQEGIWTLDARAHTTFVNRQMGDMLGMTRDEMAARPIMSFLVDADRAPLAAMLERLSGGKPERHELRFRRDDGSEFWASLSTSPIIGDDGELMGALVMVTDITEQRKIQAQLLVADRMVSVGILAAGVAHEINNPLTAVMANLDLAHALIAAPGELDAEARGELVSELGDAREAANRVREIVRDLKMFSRAPQNEDSREAVDLDRVLESCLRMAHNEIRHRARVVRGGEHVPPVLANEARLGQVFLNLLVNAAQAMDEGHAGHNEIRISTHLAADGQVVTEIVDTGVGMSQETLEQLFTPFFTTKPIGVGTGLGLAICHRLVTGMGGSISVESESGRGTTFRVALPAAEPLVSSPVAQPAIEAAVLRRGSVLVVDDEPMITYAVRHMLKQQHDIVTVNEASAALELVRHGQRFDVILSDLMMPQMTGMELHAELVKIAPDQAARMVFLTGGAFTPRAREFLERIPNLRIEKPFDTPNLRALVNGCLTSPP